MAASQKNREIAVATPLGDDVLLFHTMEAKEHLGRLFQYDLQLLSERHELDFDALLGQNLTVGLNLPDGKVRYFNGYISAFAQTGSLGRYAVYSATVRPWLWFLTLTTDCRIFQDQTVPDIIKEVFREQGFTDFEEALSDSYRTWEYCVQYRESDFAFVSRLMEQEGIYYYFKHENGIHTLVLADSYCAHDLIPDYDTVPYYPPDAHALRERDHISSWSLSQRVQPGTCALNDFHFEHPRANLQVKSSMPRAHAFSGFELYEYPGEYGQTDDGDDYARERIEAAHATQAVVDGAGNARGLTTGGLFKLREHPRRDQNQEYLIVSAHYTLHLDDYEGLDATPTPVYHCTFTAIESMQPYRSPQRTRKPLVQGPQTAIVAGKAGEEVWTDKYGRVKVQFHWDRDSKGDENSSCWIRVAQAWAGKRWGAMFIPRIGQEVIVEFLEGDPDRPIITGRVYNATTMPPHPLPANATVSTLKSNSSKGGLGYNELRFEDKKGREELYIHAEKDQLLHVKNDRREQIENDSHHTIHNDYYQHVGGDLHTNTEGDQRSQVSGSVSWQAGEYMYLRAGAHQALDAGREVHIKSGIVLVMEAGARMSIKSGLGNIDINPGGVFITCGASTLNIGPEGIYTSVPIQNAPGLTSVPLDGLGAAAEAPTLPQKIDAEAPGEVAPPAIPRTAEERASARAMASALRQAAKDGTPFVAIGKNG